MSISNKKNKFEGNFLQHNFFPADENTNIFYLLNTIKKIIKVDPLY